MTIAAVQTQQKPSPPQERGVLQRQCACGQHTNGAECKYCKPTLQRKAANQTAPETVPSSVHEVLHSPGQPLDAATRTRLEPHFDHDFSQVKASSQSSSLTIRPPGDLYEKEADAMAHKVVQTPAPGKPETPSPYAPFDGVRIHTSPLAAEASQAISADAFTVGNDIVFGAGKFAPQTTTGRALLVHELTHVAQQQTPARGIQRQPAPTPNGAAGLSPFAASLNYKEIAKAIHEAIDRIGTDEEAVYMALQRLNRDPEAIEQLKKVYHQEYEADLVGDIYGDFSGSEREYALQLINLGSADSDQRIGMVPTTVDEYKQVAQRLREAVEGGGTDEEAIYAVLLPFNRQKELIDKLKLVYEALYKESLRARLSDELSGSEADYALWLLADQPILRDNKQAEADSRVILDYIKTTAQSNAKMPPSVDPSSNFYTVLKDEYLKDYFSSPTAAKGAEAAHDKIGRQIEGGVAEIGGQQVPVIKPEGKGWRQVENRWEFMALAWLNRQQIPPQLQNIQGAPILQNIKGLPSQLGAATEVLTKEKWDKLGFIDVPHLLGKPNTSQDFDADVREGGKNISQLMHWATGVRYSDQSLIALRELFLGYEKWHLEGFDVFGQDALNDMIAEYQGALLGKELRKGSAGMLKTEADLLPFLTRSFLESRAWVGAILKLRTTELDNWILAKQQAAASMHWQKEEEVWHSRTVYQLLADGMSVEDVKKSFIVESAIEIYTLIYESDEWQKTNGPVKLSPLEQALVQGKLDTLLKVMAKAEDKKAGTRDYIQAKSALDDLKKMK